MNPQQAMQMALKALEEASDSIEHWGTYTSEYFQNKHDLRASIAAPKKAADALRAALSAEQEPVRDCADTDSPWLVCKPCFASGMCAMRRPAPAAQPLTDEQCDKLRQENGGVLNFVTLRAFRVIARAIERAHGIGDKA